MARSQNEELEAHDEDATAARVKPVSSAPPVDPSEGLLEGLEGMRRYDVTLELGRGSMGEVRLCRDARIGRDVAMKVILPSHRDDSVSRGRFLREVRVQGQLEHPSIAPVYDLGVDDAGSLFFTMKRLRGLTLKQIVTGLRRKDAEITKNFSRRRLLGAFSQVCLAVDFAHERGVIHRDLKPSNVMLGSHGEVYVLDWGIAKLKGGAEKGVFDHSGAEVYTAAGKILGTFGYMAPEQALGKVADLDARSDVYALGALLFEILTLEPLHPKQSWNAVLHSTIKGVSARPSERAPGADVPPELEEICVKATMLEPADRHQTARALHEAVERWLDGDRDVELRRALAAGHARAAEDAAERAISGHAGAVEARREALAAVGRTLALDPGNEAALVALTRLIAALPREVPAEVAARVEAHAAGRHRLQLRDGVKFDLAGLSLLMPISVWMGIRDWAVMAAAVALTFVSSGLKMIATRTPLRVGYGITYGAYLSNVLAVLCLSRGFGPLLFTPTLLAMFTFAYSMSSKARYRLTVMATGAFAFLASVAAERLGWVLPSYAFEERALSVLPRAVELPAIPTITALTVGSLFLIVAPALMMGRLQSRLREAEERAFLQTWQLRQLLPAGAPVAGA